MRTKEEINAEIKALYEERNRTNAITVDGVPIVAGLTVYGIDLGDFTRYVIAENVQLKENGVWQTEPFCCEDYTDLYADLDKAIEATLARAKDEVRRAELRLEGAKKQLAKVEQNVQDTIKSWDCQHENALTISTTVCAGWSEDRKQCMVCRKIWTERIER
jgi:hypothetical protein